MTSSPVCWEKLIGTYQLPHLASPRREKGPLRNVVLAFRPQHLSSNGLQQRESDAVAVRSLWSQHHKMIL